MVHLQALYLLTRASDHTWFTTMTGRHRMYFSSIFHLINLWTNEVKYTYVHWLLHIQEKILSLRTFYLLAGKLTRTWYHHHRLVGHPLLHLCRAYYYIGEREQIQSGEQKTWHEEGYIIYLPTLVRQDYQNIYQERWSQSGPVAYK